MTLPNFICVGAQKAGTSTLHNLLKQHPDICLPKEKETHFFINGEDKYAQGISWYSQYFFTHCQEEKMIGEISPGYLYMDYIPKRLCHDLGTDLKLIFLLRNPIQRAYSGYLMTKRIAADPLDFEEAIIQEAERIGKDEKSLKMYSYGSRGLYNKQIEEYLKYFPIENMFFIVFETELIQNTKKTMQELCNFLDLSPFSFQLDIQKNIAREAKSKKLMHFLYADRFLSLRKKLKYILPSKKLRNQIKFTIGRMNSKTIVKKENIKPDTIVKLKKYFYKDIKSLEKLIGKDLSHWLSSSKEVKNEKNLL